MTELNRADREFLAYALDVAEGRTAIRPGEFSRDDGAALRRLRHVATCQRACGVLCGRESDEH